MKTVTLLLFVAVVVLASAAPRDYETHPANVARRSPQYTKGKIPVRAGYAPKAAVEGSIGNTANPSLRKGEYMCGDKICKLQPGEIPKGCNGMCQYKVK
ncbi:uncharacterized protein LOC123701614 isoform X4 [Colias croceus]|uniref:uncharacterized protein LOC123701614 isoform X4 n=1 Tax=Colias crocea TaxID=72248 RepID=UPI001E27D015|nr:uncharacterized protein LOC123701614 isoform X4 [Colias croceus]